jgi:hypothetical protein
MSCQIGITLVPTSGTIVESVDLEMKADTKVLIDSAGAFSEARVIDSSYSFSVKGKGTPTVTIGADTGAPEGTSGKVIITSVKHSYTNDDWEGYEYSGVAYPSAT